MSSLKLLFFILKCHLPIEFFNPNASGEMAQLLKRNHENYTPCQEKDGGKVVLQKIPLHGDQLFEERARNVKWAFRDGLNDVEKLIGLDTEFADWHAKYTLYKVMENIQM